MMEDVRINNEKTFWEVACTGDIYAIVNDGEKGRRVFRVVGVGIKSYWNPITNYRIEGDPDLFVIEVGNGG